ncbi:MAG TPA: hypothetical protein DEO40_05265 [Treponema sp.]|jgi:hypothetical protein|nr:hypothetical protein [Treponema sp.]MBO5607499.1 hypothetical protein [Treponema sp.]HBB43256.1 hypothetical protein [Treponema sp.]HCA20066.1 hypothetical protein [Treponema sp.]
MIALIVGILLIAFCVFACLPAGTGLAWGADVVNFLKGCAPVFAAFVGLVAVFIGFADIKDKKEAKKEEAAAKALENEQKK